MRPGELADDRLADASGTLDDWRPLRVTVSHSGEATPGDAMSAQLVTVMAYVKFLDEALARLPARFHYEGEVERGVRWVYPSPDEHDPVKHFPKVR